MQRKMLTEEEATEQFISCIPAEYFKVYPQRKGEAIYVKKLKRQFADWDKRKVPMGGRVDFILEPTSLLEKCGWEIGCIGVEIKSSFDIKYKPGKAIVQVLDYQSCMYSLPTGKTTELSMIFLFPYRYTAGLIASIMQQEGLGFVSSDPSYDARFRLLQANSNEPVFTYYANGKVEIRRPRYGKTFGHR